MQMRPRSSIVILAVLAGAVILAACGPTRTATTGPSAAPSAAASGDASAATGTGGTGSQSDTEWGRIWDDVPTGFPIYPGSTVADDSGPEAVSATYAIAGGGDPAQIASWMQAALETATFSTEALSGPLEDGSFVLDSVGEGECKIQVVVAPMGGLTFVTVRYGAACPAA
jgi:hypothetical protein